MLVLSGWFVSRSTDIITISQPSVSNLLTLLRALHTTHMMTVFGAAHQTHLTNIIIIMAVLVVLELRAAMMELGYSQIQDRHLIML